MLYLGIFRSRATSGMTTVLLQDDLPAVVQSVSSDDIAKKYWENQFVTDMDDEVNEDAAAIVQKDPLASRYWKNQFTSDTSGQRLPTKSTKSSKTRDQSGGFLRPLTAADIHRRGQAVMNVRREFFIDTLCDLLNIDRRALVITSNDDFKAIIDAALWVRPRNPTPDTYIDPTTIEYMVARVRETYGINPTRIQKMHKDAESFREFLSNVVNHDAEMSKLRKQEMENKFKSDAWGIPNVSLEDEKLPENEDPIRDRERMLSREAKGSNSRVDSILKKCLAKSDVKSDATFQPVEPQVPEPRLVEPQPAEPKQVADMSLEHFAKTLGERILPNKPKKVTISITFEM
jgi:hypothetical protein